jgi:single-strand DNA-binding protein
MSYNKIIIVGNLTRDLEIRYASSGTAIGNTGVASTRKFKGGDGQMKEEVLFVDITFFGRTAEIANQYLKKGSKILVEGRLKLDSWTDQNGGKRSKHTVVVENMTMLDSKQDSQTPQQNQPAQQQAPAQQNQPPQQTQPPQNQQGALPNDDTIPFAPMK